MIFYTPIARDLSTVVQVPGREGCLRNDKAGKLPFWPFSTSWQRNNPLTITSRDASSNGSIFTLWTSFVVFLGSRVFSPTDFSQPRCTWKDWASLLCRWTRPPNGIISSAWLLLLLISLYFPFKASRVAFSEQSRLEWIWWRPAVVVSGDDGRYFCTWDLFLGLFAGILHWAGYWMSLALKIEETRTKMLDVLCREGCQTTNASWSLGLVIVFCEKQWLWFVGGQ